MGLSEIQSSIYGPSVIIAGPGTGKTYTLIKKVESLIDYIIKNNIYESNKGILISTFTNKATEELKYRLYSSISLKKINPSTNQEKRPIRIKILRTMGDSYDFEYSQVSNPSKVNRGTVNKISN